MERGRLFEAALMLLLVFLCAMLYVMITVGTPRTNEGWSLSSLSPTAYTFAGDGGMVYMFDGNDIYAVKDGSLRWRYSVPREWTVINEWSFNAKFSPVEGGGYMTDNGMRYTGPIFSSGDSTLYLYVAPAANWNDTWLWSDVSTALGGWNVSRPGEALMAIRDGHLIWERQMPRETPKPDLFDYDDVCLYAQGGRLYVYQQHNLSVMDSNGKLLLSIQNVSHPPAVDEDGFVYSVVAARLPYHNEFYDALFPGYMDPTGMVEARYPNGTLYWHVDIGKPAACQDIDPTFGLEHRTLPLYGNGVLYVPFGNGVEALGRNGSILWTCTVNKSVDLYEKMPFDSKGNVYLVNGSEYSVLSFPINPFTRKFAEYYLANNVIGDRTIYIAGKNGVASPVRESYNGRLPVAAAEGIAYYAMTPEMDANRSSIDSLMPLDIAAVDLSSGKAIWTRKLQTGPINSVILSESNIDWVFYDESDRDFALFFDKCLQNALQNQSMRYKVKGDAQLVSILPYGGNIYASYYIYNYEYPDNFKELLAPWGWNYNDDFPPAALNRSRCDYVAGVLALDRDGTVLWQRPTGSYVMAMAANNSTIFIGTSNGGLFATGAAGITAGIAAIASAYLLLRVLILGVVSRARSRLESNENRRRVLKLVKDRPGITLYDAARALDMNMGTLRYHMLILVINHRIATHRDGKFVRYFSGSNAYTGEEREIISLLRREPVCRMMRLLRDRPGISNAELAGAVGLSESAISNYMRELSARGIVEKEPSPDGRAAYAIRDERIVSGLRLVGQD